MDRYAYQSDLRYKNAMEKLCYSLISIVICIGFRSIACGICMLIVNSFIIVYLGKTPFRTYFHALTLPVAFVVISTVTIILNFSKTPLDAFAIAVGGIYITASYQGIAFAIKLFITAISSVSALYVLNFTTPMTDIISACRKIHVPELFTELMLLIYRFIFVLNVTANSIMTAQKSRLGNKTFGISCQSFGQMGSALFIKAMKRSSALYDAMEARCYDGTIRVLEEEHKPQKMEIILISATELLFVTVSIVDRIF